MVEGIGGKGCEWLSRRICNGAAITGDHGKIERTLRYGNPITTSDSTSMVGKDFPAAEGLVDNPIKLVPGGIVAKGGISRDAVLNLIPMRAMAADGEDKTWALRRYVLGLALLALFAPASDSKCGVRVFPAKLWQGGIPSFVSGSLGHRINGRLA